MVAHIHTASFKGIEVNPIIVEAHCLPGIPKHNIVGLPDKAVNESKERIRACFHALGIELPPKAITVNLAPADVQKEGCHYDLPIALGLMAECGLIPRDVIEAYIIMGELRLDGYISSVSGVLPAALYASSIGKGIICPKDNANEAGWVPDLQILAPSNILELVQHFKGRSVLPTVLPQTFGADVFKQTDCDLKDVKGQGAAKRALEIAAAGGHHMLMIGPPGSGKSMMAKRMTSILPPLTAKEALYTTMIYSIAGMLDETGLVTQRPFREPHHSASTPALVGGGRKVKPGEISLAHNGVLFLDELPEFDRVVIDSLRQPIESGDITVSRAESHVTYPAQFQLIAAMNPCRCGYFGNVEKQCYKAPNCCFDYQSKISGPILDRFDLIVHVNSVALSDLHKEETEGSAEIRERVISARAKQAARFEENFKKSKINANLDGENLRTQIFLADGVEDFLQEAAKQLDISARRYNRILRVARTIADLNDHTQVEEGDVLEALSYRA
jgi:magnesium chelatase family protein